MLSDLRFFMTGNLTEKSITFLFHIFAVFRNRNSIFMRNLLACKINASFQQTLIPEIRYLILSGGGGGQLNQFGELTEQIRRYCISDENQARDPKLLARVDSHAG